MTERTNWIEDISESRRSVMQKGALAAGALTLGSASFGTATIGAQQQRVVVFSYRYYPGAEFTVVSQLQTSTTIEILQREGEPVPEISQPDEWSGHVIRYDLGGQSGITSFLFLRGQSMSAGDSGSLGTDASMFSSELNLLNTSLEEGAPADTDEDADVDEDVEETPTPEDVEETPEDVEETPTPEDADAGVEEDENETDEVGDLGADNESDS